MDAAGKKWAAFLAFVRPKLIADPEAKAKLQRLRQLVDLRLDKVRVKRPHLSLQELSVVVQPEKTKPRFAPLAYMARLVSAEEAKQPIDAASEAAGRFLDAALTLEVFPPAQVFAWLQEFAAAWRALEKAQAPKQDPGPQPPSDLPPNVARWLGDVKDLWAIPEVTRKLQQMLLDRETPIGDVAAELERDPALSAQVLRLVNSAFFATAQEIASVERAVAMLGYMNVRRVVTVASLTSKLGREDPSVPFDVREYWTHSLAVAQGAMHLARTAGLGEADDFFTAGIVHDIGKLVLYQYLKPQMRMILTEVRGGARWAAAEQRVLECSHALIGACVCEKWGLAGEVAAAARHHLDSADSVARANLPAAARAAVALCRLARSEGDAAAWAPVLGVAADALSEALQEGKVTSLAALRELFVFSGA